MNLRIALWWMEAKIDRYSQKEEVKGNGVLAKSMEMYVIYSNGMKL